MLVRRLVLLCTTLTVAAVPVVVATPSQARPSYQLSAPAAFSPNGDGRHEKLRVRYSVPKPTRVRLEVSRVGRGKLRVVRTVELGWKPRGSHRWTWNGRNDVGNRVGQGRYLVTLRLPNGTAVAGDRTKVDTSFSPRLSTPAYGLPVARARVFPRSTEVTDVVELTASTYETRVSDLRVVIRNARGTVVRDARADDELVGSAGTVHGYGATIPWAARRGGKPLPKGRYTAVATGRDAVGNAGTSKPMTVWVSDDRLVWKEVSTTLAASEARAAGNCSFTPSPGCADYPPCGQVVPSAIFPTGLSYRSKPCEDPASYQSRATRSNFVEYPEATGVRGVDAVRVSFTGAPTAAGAPDVGTLSVWGEDADSDVVGTSGQSGWVEHPSWGVGLAGDPDRDVPDRAPAAVWSFTTTGDDSVDVAGFTVDARYLVIAD